MKIYNTLKPETQELFKSIIIEELEHNCLKKETIADRYGSTSDLHNKCFNEDYFIIGYYQANKFIEYNFSDSFQAIDLVKEYEEDNFGEFTTSLNSESICNMLAYIIGEEITCELDEDMKINKVIKQLKKI